jgi:hypothetical protein
MRWVETNTESSIARKVFELSKESATAAREATGTKQNIKLSEAMPRMRRGGKVILPVPSKPGTHRFVSEELAPVAFDEKET